MHAQPCLNMCYYLMQSCSSRQLIIMAGGHRDYPVLASVAQWPEIQPLVSRGQLVSADLP